jgi:hypothetical protein
VEWANAAAARRIIAAQIAVTPHEVSRPIDVLQITAAGARWIERDPGSLCDPVR